MQVFVRQNCKRVLSYIIYLLTILLVFHGSSYASDIEGEVRITGKPVSGASVSLYVAGKDAPKILAHGNTDANGYFKIHDDHILAGGVFYIESRGGVATAATSKTPNNGIALLAVIGTSLPKRVIINEFSTVASCYTFARFINGESISGADMGLRIAAGNVPNFVDLSTGGWGKTIIDALNSTQSTALATFNTLSSLIAACATLGNSKWNDSFLKACRSTSGTSTPSNTLEAIACIARTPWANPKEIFDLFNEAYPQPADGARRRAPFVPYLTYVPDDFALMLCFAGGGMCANGRFMFDPEGNLWSGQNWMAGSQSGVIHSIGGGVLKMSPNGKALSPDITGFTGMGIDGVGWGTAVTKDRVWISSFNGKILVMDFNGRPVATEGDFPFKEKLLGLMGIGVAANGDVWVADGSNDQLLFFPGGRIKDGKIVKPAGLKSPFDIVIDPQNRVYVSNSQGETVVRFPANDPSKTETFRCGIIVRGLSLDSKGNVWVVSNCSFDFPMPKVPDGASIMEQFEIMGAAALRYPKSTGLVNLIKADGTQPFPNGLDGGGAIDLPWGINVDGNDDVWIGNFSPRAKSVALVAGENSSGHFPGTKTGDVIHVFKSGTIQLLTDVNIDAAGNVWAANNWNDPIAATSKDPSRPISTWGGGSGLTVIYGVASPVKPPRMGIVRRFN